MVLKVSFSCVASLSPYRSAEDMLTNIDDQHVICLTLQTFRNLSFHARKQY